MSRGRKGADRKGRKGADRKGRKGADRKDAGLKKVVLLFGESDNDCKAIKELAEGLQPKLRGCVRHVPRLVLIKGVTPEVLAKHKANLGQLVAANRVTLDVRGVLIHEDCDDVEPAHEKLAKDYADKFRDADYRVHPVLPAWELETWWLLWPKALAAYRESWREPSEFRGKNVGTIPKAKERLKQAVLPNLKAAERKRFRGYQESDSPGIAARVCQLRLVDKPEGKSDSYDHFRREISAIDF